MDKKYNLQKRSVSIIGGADGPTSVFIAGQTKRPLKIRIQQKIYTGIYEIKV